MGRGGEEEGAQRTPRLCARMAPHLCLDVRSSRERWDPSIPGMQPAAQVLSCTQSQTQQKGRGRDAGRCPVETGLVQGFPGGESLAIRGDPGSARTYNSVGPGEVAGDERVSGEVSLGFREEVGGGSYRLDSGGVAWCPHRDILELGPQSPDGGWGCPHCASPRDLGGSRVSLTSGSLLEISRGRWLGAQGQPGASFLQVALEPSSPFGACLVLEEEVLGSAGFSVGWEHLVARAATGALVRKGRYPGPRSP